MQHYRKLLLTALAIVLPAGCQQQSAITPVHAPTQASSHSELATAPSPTQALDTAAASKSIERLDVKHLPNAYRIHAKVISGGQPVGQEAFEELAALGVKTVISVDGARPDVAAAKKFGLRYVHLPHGYDGIPELRAKELAKAVRDLPGPVYIHCHHGKHRSPAAASVACVSAGLLDPSLAVNVLMTAGTSEGYRGLYASARDARPFDDQLLDELQAEFSEIARIAPLAEAMVAVEQTHDHLKTSRDAGWKSPLDHPDLDPPHEALLLREHFTEMLRSEAVAAEPAGFHDMLRQSEADAKELEAALKAGADNKANAARAKAAFDRITRNCTACHRQYRDIPLGEKGK